jgi:hypothetical protein
MTNTPVTLNSFDKLYPMRIRQYESLVLPDEASILVKINSMVEYLNSVGKLSNDVVKNWNNVMDWVLNDGLTTDVSAKIDKMQTDGVFDTIFNTNIAPSLGNLSELTTADKTNLVHALNEVKAEADGKADQSSLDTTNANIGLLSDLQTSDITSIVNAINAAKQLTDNNYLNVYRRVGYDRNNHSVTGTTPTTLATPYTIPANQLTGAGKECKVTVQGAVGAALTSGSVINIVFGNVTLAFNFPLTTGNVSFEIDAVLYDVAGGYRAYGTIRQGLNGTRVASVSGFTSTIDQPISITATLAGSSDNITIYHTDVFLLG